MIADARLHAALPFIASRVGGAVGQVFGIATNYVACLTSYKCSGNVLFEIFCHLRRAAKTKTTISCQKCQKSAIAKRSDYPLDAFALDSAFVRTESVVQ
jgi:hypothetical protein